MTAAMLATLARPAPLALTIAAGLLSASAWAAHPLQTEDTGTQGSGNVEIETTTPSALGRAWSGWSAAASTSAPPTCR